LGLSIAAELVTLMGGRLSVASEPGQGAKFTCDLHFGVCPNDADEQPIQPFACDAMPAARAGARPLHVLVVDDTEANRHFVSAILEARGPSVVTAACGSEALAAIGREAFDVALMDVRMPDCDGIETTAQIREHERRCGARHLPIVALTADCLSDSRRRCLDAGMYDYLGKPFPTPVLIQRVEHWGATAEDLAPVATAPLVDVETALARLEGNVPLWHGLIRLFHDDGPRLLAEMRTALDERDERRLVLAAHRFRGLAANFSADQATSLAEQLEQAGLNSDFSAAESSWAKLAVVGQQLQVTLVGMRNAGSYLSEDAK
jgi:CheY-like chemotaxis protein/HPt (histidine-containing phosphotransfer) domain-containing protein